MKNLAIFCRTFGLVFVPGFLLLCVFAWIVPALGYLTTGLRIGQTVHVKAGAFLFTRRADLVEMLAAKKRGESDEVLAERYLGVASVLENGNDAKLLRLSATDDNNLALVEIDRETRGWTLAGFCRPAD